MSATDIRKKMYRKLTDAHDIAEPAQRSEIKVTLLDLPTAIQEQGHRDWASITESQEDNTDTRERTESSAGTEIDASEDDFNDHAESHGVKWDAPAVIDLLPPAGAGDGTITREGPGAPRSRGDTADATGESENEEGNQQTEGACGVTDCVLDDGGDGLTGWDVCQHGDFGKHEADGDQEAKTGKHVH